jgi:hypothetical protein
MRLLDGATAPITGDGVRVGRSLSFAPPTFQANLFGTGAISATIAIDVSNDDVNFVPSALTLSPNGTTSAFDGGVIDAAWLFFRARVVSISGTGAAVTVVMGA